MAQKYLLAIDAGTGSVRAVVFDMDGNQISIGQREWEHFSENGISGSMNFDYNKNWILTKEVIKEALSKIDSKNVIAISSTSMREGIVLYDKNKHELFAVANVDSRASKEVVKLKQNYPNIEEEFYKISGQTFALGALPRLLWVKNNRPEIYEKICYISMINDWILFKLSGEIVCEPSNAGTSGIFNLSSRNFESNFAKKVGLKDNIFPNVLESGEVVGKVKEDIANEFNLNKNCLVAVGGGDVQLGSVGLGVINRGDSAILGGSFWQQVVNVDKDIKLSGMDIRFNPHIIKEYAQAEGITFFSGLIMRWFRDAFCKWEKEIAKQQGVDVYEILEKGAKDVPVGSYGVIPIFSDEMKYGKWYHASPSFINLSIDSKTCNTYTLFRALEENAAIVSGINLKKVKKIANVEINSIVFAGGASKGKLWSQILADVLGMKIQIPAVKEATALGAAMAAGVGAKEFSNFKEAAEKFVKFEKTIEPNLNNTKKYSEIEEKWREIYTNQLKLVDSNLTNSMWRAPGV